MVNPLLDKKFEKADLQPFLKKVPHYIFVQNSFAASRANKSIPSPPICF